MHQGDIKLVGSSKSHIFEKIISLENLFLAWKEFHRGKKNKPDVQQFEFNLENNLFQLHCELINKIYRHSYYNAFNICDPKPRHIHKACVRDRVLHHAIFRILYPIFDRTFIFDSYSCRIKKGVHKAVNRFQRFALKVSKNNTQICFVIKCDIRKFFNSVNRDILIDLIKKKIKGENTFWLIEKIIKSFNKGLPLGNITSQLFANIYLNELDQFIKQKLKIKHYIRYCDDFVILDSNKEYLEKLVFQIDNFLKGKLKLFLHSDKITIRKYHQGIDFLGYVSFPHHRILRAKTKKRIFKKISQKIINLKQNKITEEFFNQSVQSYLGILKHCNGYKLKKEILNKLLF